MHPPRFDGPMYSISRVRGSIRYEFNTNLKAGYQDVMAYLDSIQAIYDAVGRPFPTLSIVNAQIHFSSSARKYFRQYEEREMMVAHAIVIPNTAMLAMMKFILVLVPCRAFEIRLFRNASEAEQWLEHKMSISQHRSIEEVEYDAIDKVIQAGAFPRRFQMDGSISLTSK